MTDAFPPNLLTRSAAQHLHELPGHSKDAGVDGWLLFSAASVAYLAGYETPIESGPAAYAPHPAALLCMNGEAPELFLADAERLPDPPTSLLVTPFASYTIDRPLPGLSGLIELLLARLRRHAGAKIGIEPDETPAAVLTALIAGLPGLQMVDASDALRHLRMIKTLDERALLRAAVRLTDTGQQTAKRMARPGMTEIEVYGEIHKSMEMMAGTRVPILPDVLSGTRTAEVGGPPSDRAMAEGELVLIDLVPRLHGYWGDSCNTFAVDEPSSVQRVIMDGIERVLAGAIAMVRPGLLASELHGWMHAEAAKIGPAFGHHAGHGLGVAWHEEPRITSYNDMPLEAGMVIALEPGVYFPGEFGVRKEAIMEVTSTGADVYTGWFDRQ